MDIAFAFVCILENQFFVPCIGQWDIRYCVYMLCVLALGQGDVCAN